MVIFGPYISILLGKTPLGRWFSKFKGWVKARQLKISEQLKVKNAAKNTPKTTNFEPQPEYIGEGLRMKDQPFEGGKSTEGPSKNTALHEKYKTQLIEEGAIKKPGSLDEILADPQSLSGLSESEITSMLTQQGFEPGTYSGTSNATKYVKINETGQITHEFIINRGGGVHGAAQTNPIYYKYVVRNPGVKPQTTKIIADPQNYQVRGNPMDDPAMIIDGQTGQIIKGHGKN